MDASPNSPSPAELLAHSGWLRGLALRLAGDVHAADDLVQETWLAALQHPPQADRPLRPWLATVLGNLLRARRRRRTTSELVLEPRSAAAEPGAEVARFETQRFLVDAVDELAEPYRTAVIQRFFAGIQTADVARAENIAPATARWRVHEGLERLRRRLDEREHGDRDAWSIVLLDLARSPAPVPALSGLFGGLVMYSLSKSGVLTLAALTLALFGLWRVGFSVTPGEPPALDELASVMAQPEEFHAPLAVDQAGADVEREPMPAVSPVAVALELELPLDLPEGGGDPALTGHAILRFVDIYGTAIAMVRAVPTGLRSREQAIDGYAWPGEVPELISDANGEVEIDYPMRMGANYNTGLVSFEARHTHFIPHDFDLSVSEVAGADAVREVVLQRGGLVALSGWVVGSDDRIVDVRARLSRSAHPLPDWVALGDGRPRPSTCQRAHTYSRSNIRMAAARPSSASPSNSSWWRARAAIFTCSCSRGAP